MYQPQPPPGYQGQDQYGQQQPYGQQQNFIQPNYGQPQQYQQQQPGGMYVPQDGSLNQPSPMTADDENGGLKSLLGFDENSARLGFIRKVYSILAVQLTLTAAMTVLPFAWQGYKDFQRLHWWIAVLCLIVMIITEYMIICYREIARTVPTNYIVLGIFTAAEGYGVSIVCSFYDGELVLMALALTAAVTVALTLYACTTKTDFTYLGGILFTLAVCAFVAAIYGIFFRSRMMDLLYSIIIVCIYSIYLIYDTQVIIGGDHQFKISLDDYIVGALIIYVDIIILFLRILRILAILSGKK